MKKLINILILSTMLQSCFPLLIFQNSSDWDMGPKAGEPGSSLKFSSKDILSRKKVVQIIGEYSISMPENMAFKKGRTTHDQDRILDKKRKFLYDNITKTADTIYLLEDTIENLTKVAGYELDKDKNRDRYRIGDAGNGNPGVIIKIKPKLYLFCKTYENEDFNGDENCEALVKVIQGE